MGVKITIVIDQNSQSVANNTSNVTVRVNAVWDNGSYNLTQKSGWLEISGFDRINFNSPFNTGRTTSGVAKLFETTVNVPHSDDGKKTITCKASYTSGVSSGTVGASASKVLTTIPRKSTLNASNGTLGQALTLSVAKQASSFTHTITYKCGSASGTVCTKNSNTSISWTPPIDLSSQNTTGTSVSITFTITTYNGNTSVGSNTKTISCSIPSSVKPSCTISLSGDGANHVNTYGRAIQGISKFNVTINSTTSYGSAIKSWNATADGSIYTTSSFTTGVVKNASGFNVEATVTDARGRTSDKASFVTVPVYAYSRPNISKLTVHRCNSDGSANDRGEYVKVNYAYSITSLGGKNASTAVLKYKKTSASTSAYVSQSLSTTDGSYVFAADSGSSYDIKLEIADNFNTSSRTAVVSTAFTLMHWRADGTGMGIGKLSELSNVLDIGFQTRFHGGLKPPILEPDTNLNDVRTPNSYVGANATSNRYVNCPEGTSGTFILLVDSAGNEYQVRQKFIRCHKTEPTEWERFYYSDGSGAPYAWGAWQKCQPMIDSGWQILIPASDFAVYDDNNYSQIRYRKIGKMVEVSGIVTPTQDITGSTTQYTIATLPPGYRPSGVIYSICQGSVACTWMLRISYTGTLCFARYRNGDAYATAKAGDWLPFQATFFVD